MDLWIMIFKPLFSSIHNIAPLMWILLIFSMLPTTTAVLTESSPFPQLTFKSFSNFIEKNFSSEIKLSTVLMMLFSIMENPDLLSLHARQWYSLVKDEKVSSNNGWIMCLSRAIYAKVDSSKSKLLLDSDLYEGIPKKQVVANLAIKLDKFAQHLDLIKYNKKGHLQSAVKPISYKAIETAYHLPYLISM